MEAILHSSIVLTVPTDPIGSIGPNDRSSECPHRRLSIIPSNNTVWGSYRHGRCGGVLGPGCAPVRELRMRLKRYISDPRKVTPLLRLTFKKWHTILQEDAFKSSSDKRESDHFHYVRNSSKLVTVWSRNSAPKKVPSTPPQNEEFLSPSLRYFRVLEIYGNGLPN